MYSKKKLFSKAIRQNKIIKIYFNKKIIKSEIDQHL